MNNLTDSLVHEQQEEQTPKPSTLSCISRRSSFLAVDSSQESASLIPIFANSVISTSEIPIEEHDFKLTKPSFPHIHSLKFIQTLPNATLDFHPIFMIERNNKSEDEVSKKDQEGFVSEELIDCWNSQVGNAKNSKKAQKLIEKMRRIGGLYPSISDEELDIPSARIGLCLLAGLDNQENKMNALNSLLAILKNDTYEKNSSLNLVKLAIKLLRLMDREVIQAVDLEAQNKIAEVYNILTETLHHHYGKRHINAITTELKNQLLLTANSLEKLNRLEDVKLKFNVNCALEGVHRLKDDRQELFELVERISNLAIAATSLYMEDAYEGFKSLKDAFKDINPHLPKSWYNAVLILKSLARGVKDNPNQLTPLLMLIGKKHKKLNWKFSYAAQEILFNLALYGENEKVRLRAFTGIKKIGHGFPGLAHFASCRELRSYASLKPMIHFKRPQKINPNTRIRNACMEHLIELVQKSTDDSIVQKAKYLLKKWDKKEVDSSLLDKYNEAIIA